MHKYLAFSLSIVLVPHALAICSSGGLAIGFQILLGNPVSRSNSFSVVAVLNLLPGAIRIDLG